MLNDEQRKMVKGHFKRNPEDEGTDTDAVTGRLEVDFSMTGTDEQHDLSCAIRVTQVHAPKRDVATLLRGCVLKKLIGMFSEEISRLLKDDDRVVQMVHEADNEVERECRAFTQKEGGAK